MMERSALANFVSRTYGADPAGLRLDVRPLRGGLESSSVARVSARWTDIKGKPKSTTFVAKHLRGRARREAELYSLLAEQHTDITPRFLGIDDAPDNSATLYLEWVRQSRAWPWRELPITSGVLTQLARLHAGATQSSLRKLAQSWDYEAELAISASDTLMVFERAVRTQPLAHFRKYGPALRRLVSNLPQLRKQLSELQPFGQTVLHGDVHSRNVVLRTRRGVEQAVFLDWGRARVGSPLEDVSSWLQSLGGWEYAVRRRHDTLLRSYIEARGFGNSLERAMRDAYWLASASNSLSGALSYHLSVATDTEGRTERERIAATGAARLHLRVIRRADALWRA